MTDFVTPETCDTPNLCRMSRGCTGQRQTAKQCDLVPLANPQRQRLGSLSPADFDLATRISRAVAANAGVAEQLCFAPVHRELQQTVAARVAELADMQAAAEKKTAMAVLVALQEVDAVLCGIKPQGRADGNDLISRDSVIDLVRRRVRIAHARATATDGREKCPF